MKKCSEQVIPPIDIQKSALAGNAEAQFQLACFYKEIPTISPIYQRNTIFWLTKAAEQGHPEACYDLANHLSFSLEDDISEAELPILVELLTKAAKQGHAKAQYELAYRYYGGRGVEKNNALAFEWWLKAAEQGNEFAQSMIGTCYEKGIGVKKNIEIAINWYKKAAELDNWEAQEDLVRLGISNP